MVELYIIKLLYIYNNYIKYNIYISKYILYIKDNNNILYIIYNSICLYHDSFPSTDITSAAELEAFIHAQYPALSKTEKDALASLLVRLEQIEISESAAASILAKFRQTATANQIAIKALEVAEGRREFTELVESVEALQSEDQLDKGNEFIQDSQELYEQITNASSGFSWRLRSLNQSLGPLRVGDFGFIFKRPESGGTTFVASEVSFMAEKAESPIIWFNNEEQGSKVLLRIKLASLGITGEEFNRDYKGYTKKFNQLTKGNIKVYDAEAITRSDVDRLCNKYKPCLIVFDQLDKIRGFADDRYDLELKHVYQWARELAKRFGPVIGVCQAGGTAEGKRYLTMDDVDSSKTSKQGEADWILGIGKSNNEGMESIRHFHICKNKLLGSNETIPELRHGKFDVRIKAEIARFEDI